MRSEILQPVTVLVLWSLVMLVWLMAVRGPAFKKAGLKVGELYGSGPGRLDKLLDEKTQWPAHNFMHLMEQPTLFYAAALALAFMGQGDGFNAQVAWVYVVFRVLHSLVQATFNRVAWRLPMFLGATLALMVLAVHAAMAAFGVGVH